MEDPVRVRDVKLNPIEMLQIASELNKVGFSVSVKVSDGGATILKIRRRKYVIESSKSHPNNYQSLVSTRRDSVDKNSED